MSEKVYRQKYAVYIRIYILYTHTRKRFILKIQKRSKRSARDSATKKRQKRFCSSGEKKNYLFRNYKNIPKFSIPQAVFRRVPITTFGPNFTTLASMRILITLDTYNHNFLFFLAIFFSFFFLSFFLSS